MCCRAEETEVRDGSNENRSECGGHLVRELGTEAKGSFDAQHIVPMFEESNRDPTRCLPSENF
jgi:hypothetical protein